MVLCTTIVPQMQKLAGKLVTIWAEKTTGATVDTITIPNHLPDFDLKCNNPVISGAIIMKSAAADLSLSYAMQPNKNVGRGVTPDAADQEWGVQTRNTISYSSSNKDTAVMLTYLAAGGRKY